MTEASHPRAASLLLPGVCLFFGLTVLLLRNPSQYPLVALIFFSFVIMLSVLVSMELASVFAVLVSLVELVACALVKGGDRAWLAGQVLILWTALYAVHRFVARDTRDEQELADDRRESRRGMTSARKEKASLERRLDGLESQTVLWDRLSRAVQKLAGLKDPLLIRQRLMESARSFIPRGTVHFFTGHSPRDTLDEWVMQKLCPLLVTDVQRDSRFKPLHPGSEVRSILAAPVVSEARLVGLIRLNGFEPHLFSMGDLRLLEYLSIQASMALETVELRERLRESAAYDTRTGLFSPRLFRERLADEILRGGRYRTGFCVLVIEVDQAQRYAETYGQTAHDQIAARVAQTLRACCRDIDFAACYREGAFAILLPQTARSEACALAQGVQKQIASESFSFGPEAVMQERVGVRAGMAVFPDEAATASQLLRLAEERLAAGSTTEDRNGAPG